jgi:hypothetical protein
MKRIVRLTESDLTRIVRRVIMEVEDKTIVDAGYSDDLGGYAVAYGTPVASAGDSKGVKVSFTGVRFSFNGKKTYGGTVTLYGKCGENVNPSAMSPVSVADLYAGGSYYRFGQGGAVDKAARNFCKSKYGVTPTGGVSGDFKSEAQSIISQGLK